MIEIMLTDFVLRFILRSLEELELNSGLANTASGCASSMRYS